MARRSTIALGVVLACGCPQALHAQVRQQYEYPDPSLRSPYQIGDSPFFMRPYVGVAAGHDDNVVLSRENKRSSDFWMVSPGITVDARRESTALLFKYQAQAARYSDSRDDDYVDHAARGAIDWSFDRRNFLRAAVDYAHAREPRGSTDRPIAERPDRYRLVVPSATYAFGAPGARGHIEVYASEAMRRYRNNRERTAISDRDTTEVGAAFSVRLAPKTNAIVEVRHTDIGYKRANPAEATERRYYGGITWQATGATSGTLKVGRLERSFDNGPEDSATSWEALVTWTPRSYSRFDFLSARQTNEPTGQGRFILTSIAQVTWTHGWNSRFTTGVDLRYQKDDYRGFDRRDETTSMGLKAGYRFRRWLTLGAEYTHSERDSNRPFSEYDKNFYLLTATASM